MAILSDHFYASSVVQQNSSVGSAVMQITNPLPALVLPSIPCAYTFYSVFSIQDFDFSKNHSLKILFMNTESHMVLFSAEANLKPEDLQEIQKSNELLIPPKYLSIVSSIAYQNVFFTSTGVYKTTFMFDDQDIGGREIYVTGKSPK